MATIITAIPTRCLDMAPLTPPYPRQ
jgi:hypothetical protein